LNRREADASPDVEERRINMNSRRFLILSVAFIGLSMIAGMVLAQGPLSQPMNQQRQGADNQFGADRAHAVAALEPVGGTDGWGRMMVRDHYLPDDSVRRQLVLRVVGLEADTEYTTVIDGITVGSLVTDPAGDGSLRLGWPEDLFPPVPADLPPAEVLGQAAVLDASLGVVLEGEFVTDWVGGSGPQDLVYLERIQLDPTDNASLRGVAKVTRTDEDEQSFESRACSLEVGAVYELYVDGFLAGAVTGDSVGHGELELSTADANLPMELQPIEDLRLVEWIDAGGDVILTGSFTGENMVGGGHGGGPGGGGHGGNGSGNGGNGGSGGNGGGNGGGQP
jgi:hypothetical protein